MKTGVGKGGRRWPNAILTVGLVVGGCGGAPEVPTLTVGWVGVEGSTLESAAQAFARRLEEVHPGGLRVQVRRAQGDRDEGDLVSEARRGALDLALVSYGLSSEVPVFALFDLPYLLSGPADLRALDAPLLDRELVPAARATGLEVVSAWGDGFRHLATRGATAPSGAHALSGMRVGMPRSVWRLALAETWEMDASTRPGPGTAAPVRDTPAAPDAIETSLPDLARDTAHTFDGVLLTAHLYSPAFLVAGSAPWSRLPPDLRASIRSVATELGPVMAADTRTSEQRARQTLDAQGVAFAEPDREALRAAAQPLYERFARTVPEGARLLALVNSVRIR